VTHLSCSRCRRDLDHRVPQNLCPCGSPLLVEYDLDALAGRASKESIASGPPTMWRYGALLPVADPTHVVTLGEGLTPLLPAADLGRRVGLPGLLVKDEGPNPTGTFKARGASCGVSMALELGIRKVALPTAGNAGAAWACYGAAAGLEVLVAMPADAPELNRLECELYGADVQLVDGLISDAAAVVAQEVERRGWFEVSTLKEPYRIEGKKTLGFEIGEQLGWRMPDAIVYPAGGGVGIIGIWRAIRQLRAIGWVQGDGPRLVVTQAQGCAPIVEAFEHGWEESRSWPEARTFAHGIRVPKALGDFLVLQAIRETGGTAIAVSDEEIAHAMADLGRAGISACPEGAATLAAASRLRERGDLSQDERVVLINTGTALKDRDAMARALGPGPDGAGGRARSA
jgi:threonine synthase